MAPRGKKARSRRSTGKAALPPVRRDTKKDAAEREQAAASFRALGENIPDFAVLMDRDGRILFINRPFPELEPHRVVGRAAADFLHPIYRATFLEHFERVIGTGETAEFEVEAPGPTRELRRYENRLAPIREGDAITGAVLIARDITQRRSVYRQLALTERLASVGRLAAGIAHEINNPLAYVLANLGHVLETCPEDASIRQPLLEAHEGARRVRDIVRDLLSLYRGDEAVEGCVDIAKVIDSVIQISRPEISRRAELIREDRRVPLVKGVEGRLAQLFLNLVMNAAQAIPPERRGRIVITTERGIDGNVVVEVGDDGVGIAPEHLANIFDPFFTTKPVGAGAGLGLAICHRIVTEIGGRIEAESVFGRGSTFRVHLPATTRPSDVVEPRTPVPPKRRHGRRVLVVDDEPFVARSIERVLRPRHEVAIARSAAEALKRLGEDRFDIVLCDVMMPGKTGIDLYDEVAEHDPHIARRFVFVTGAAFSDEVRERLASLGRKVVMKPFDPREIVELVEQS